MALGLLFQFFVHSVKLLFWEDLQEEEIWGKKPFFLLCFYDNPSKNNIKSTLILPLKKFYTESF